MKTILILAMSCRADYFCKQIDIIKKTWANNLPDGISFGYYDGAWPEPSIDDEDGFLHIKVSTPDSLDYTLLKTVEGVSSIVKKYDYIMRVNTSTWVNVKLLRKFVDEIANEDTIYASELYSLSEAATPFPLIIYPRGNAFMMSQKMWMTFIMESLPLRFVKQVDDVSIGSIMNSWMIKNNINLLEHYYSWPHGWYKCTKSNPNTGHALCRFGENGDVNFYKDFMTVQTKQYRARENELINMEEFGRMMQDIKDPSLDVCIKYAKDPSVFIGSALGYIPLSVWKNIDKNKLYKIETDHKAIDDKQNKNFVQEEYDKLHYVPGMKK